MVNKNVCIGCGSCVGVCPVGAISMVNGQAYIDQNKCIHCGMCQNICPVGAISGQVK